MTEESQLQLARQANNVSVGVSPARSLLISRGLRDAALLRAAKLAGPSILYRICNKCGEHKALVLADSVCGACSETLDLLAKATANDWVILAPFERPRVPDILRVLKENLAKAKGQQLDPEAANYNQESERVYGRYIYRDITYEEIKLRWATRDSPSGDFVGETDAAEVAQLESIAFAWSRDAGPVFVRPATPEEIREHDDNRRNSIVWKTLAQWGFDDEWSPKSGVWDDEARLRAEDAFQEIKKGPEQSGLLEGSDYEYDDLAAGEKALKEKNDRSQLAEEVQRWRRAAEQGDADAKFHLGCAYLDGRGLSKDVMTAAKLLFEAAEDENRDALDVFSYLYSNNGGHGNPPDFRTVAYAFLMAFNGIDAQGEQARLLDEIEKKLTVQQLTDARSLALGWKAKD